MRKIAQFYYQNGAHTGNQNVQSADAPGKFEISFAQKPFGVQSEDFERENTMSNKQKEIFVNEISSLVEDDMCCAVRILN